MKLEAQAISNREAWLEAAAAFSGPPTATKVGDTLRPLLLAYIERVGSYPHAAITVKSKEKVGSRLRLYQCRCSPPVKVRVASDSFAAVCVYCDAMFERVESEVVVG